MHNSTSEKMPSGLKLSEQDHEVLTGYVLATDPLELSFLNKEIPVASLSLEQKAISNFFITLDDATVLTFIYLFGFKEIIEGGQLAKTILSTPSKKIFNMIRNMSGARSTWNLAKAISLMIAPSLEGFIADLSFHLTEKLAVALQAKYSGEIDGKTPAKKLDSLKRCVRPSTKHTDSWINICTDAFHINLEKETSRALMALIHTRNIAAHAPDNLRGLGFFPKGEDVTGWLFAARLAAQRIYASVTNAPKVPDMDRAIFQSPP